MPHDRVFQVRCFVVAGSASRGPSAIAEPLVFQIQHNFTSSKDLCKLGKENLNALTCKFYPFYGQNSKTFDISRAFLPLTVASYQLSQTVHFWITL